MYWTFIRQLKLNTDLFQWRNIICFILFNASGIYDLFNCLGVPFGLSAPHFLNGTDHFLYYPFYFILNALDSICFSWSIIVRENWWIAPKSRKTWIFHGFLSGSARFFISQKQHLCANSCIFHQKNLVFRNSSISFRTNSIKHGSYADWWNPIYAKFVINVSTNTLDWRWSEPREKIHQYVEVSIDIVSIQIRMSK